ncbi:MAG: hypothetical protein ACOYOB_19675 [Myxococcota bacterium]
MGWVSQIDAEETSADAETMNFFPCVESTEQFRLKTGSQVMLI